MGAINEIFSQNIFSFQKIEEILGKLLEQNQNKAQNLKTLQEIGYLKEFSSIKYDKAANEFIDFSKENKMIKSYVNSEKLKDNFLEWTLFLFGIYKEDLDSVEAFNKKIQIITKNPLNKEFFQNNIKKFMFKDKIFNNLITNGIPKNFREFIWDLAIAEKYANHNFFNYEEEKKKYNSYLKNVQNNPQVEKDLKRTFINNSEKSAKNIQSLRNVLNCITKYNNEYCQGMNFIAGYLLKLTNFDETKTFYIIKNIFDDIQGYFEDNFPLLKTNINTFDNYFKELYPKLYAHFKQNDLFNELWVGKWLQTLFTLSLPFEELCHVWDILIIKGFDFIIYICLAIIDSIEEELLKLNDSSDILSFMNNYLNPNKTTLVYKGQFDREINNIMPLNNILLKAFKIRKKIHKNKNKINKMSSDNNVTRFNPILKKEKSSTISDYDSTYTKESENNNSIYKKASFSSKSSSIYSSLSSITNSNNKSSTSSKTQSNITILKIDLCENNLQPKKTIYKKPNFYSSKNVNHFGTLLKGINIDNNNMERGSVNPIRINSNLNSLGNSYNTRNINYPIKTGQNIYYNNMNYNLMNYRAQYGNYLTYYS